MMSVRHRGRKTPSTGGQDSQSKDCFLSRKCEVRISSQHSAHMHLYTNVSSWVLSILLSEAMKSQLFLLHLEPVLPSWTSEATTTLPTNLKNTSEQLAQLEQALNSVPSALSFTFGTHSTTLSHRLPQMRSPSPRDAIKHCLRSPQASDPRLPNTRARAKPTCVQLAQETKRCLLHAWIRSTCNHLQLCLRVSTWWLPAHPSSTTSDHQLDSIDRGSQAIWEVWRSTAHRSSVSCEQETSVGQRHVWAKAESWKDWGQRPLWTTLITSVMQRSAGHSSALRADVVRFSALYHEKHLLGNWYKKK